MAIAIIGYSFAKRDAALEPNPCNERIGSQIMEIKARYEADGYEVFVASQWEVTRAIEALGGHVDVNVDPSFATSKYLTTEDVWNAVDLDLRREGITEVIPVAQPFLHLGNVKKLMGLTGEGSLKYDSYKDLHVKIGHVGYDNSKANKQWWTKSAPALFAYGCLQILGKILGKDFHGLGEEE